MILIPKYLEAELYGQSRVGMAGFYKLTKGKNLGHMDVDRGVWVPGRDVITGGVPLFSNIITNYGMNRFGNGSHLFQNVTYSHVGTGTTAAVVTDTSLETWVNSQNAGTATDTAQGSAPYYGKYTNTIRHGEGDAEGNISEVGMSGGATNTNMFSRALVVDGGGSPTTIPVASDEWLDVYYEFRMYPYAVTAGGAADDATGSITISGSGVHNYTLRPALVNNATHHSASDCRGQFETVWPGTIVQGFAGGSTAVLGGVTEVPAASDWDGYSAGIGAGTYTTNSFTRDGSQTIGLTQANRTGGVLVIAIPTGQGQYQIEFDPIVPKDAIKVWVYNHRFSWARATI